MKKILKITIGFIIVLSTLNLSFASSSVKAADTYGEIIYRSHVQDLGTLPYVSYNGTNDTYSGTVGKAKHMEGLEIRSAIPLEYSVYSSGKGWFSGVSNGPMLGTKGENRPLLDICIAPKDKFKYMIYYQAHIQDYGWTREVTNGTSVVSGIPLAYQAKPVEAIFITYIQQFY